jgi:hypothetical protein
MIRDTLNVCFVYLFPFDLQSFEFFVEVHVARLAFGGGGQHRSRLFDRVHLSLQNHRLVPRLEELAIQVGEFSLERRFAVQLVEDQADDVHDQEAEICQ